MFTEKTEVETFLKENFGIMGNYYISDNGIVDINVSIQLVEDNFNKLNLTELPIQFGYIEGNFEFDNANIKSLKGFPNTVGGYCSITGCKNINSFELAPNSKIFYYNKGVSGLSYGAFNNLDGLNCKDFSAYDLILKSFGTNFSAKKIVMANIPTPTALKKHTEEFSMLDEIMYLNNKKTLFKYISTMRHLIKLNTVFDTRSVNKFTKLLKRYNQHQDLFRTVGEFEELYNEPWVKPEDRIEIIPSSNGLSL